MQKRKMRVISSSKMYRTSFSKSLKLQDFYLDYTDVPDVSDGKTVENLFYFYFFFLSFLPVDN